MYTRLTSLARTVKHREESARGSFCAYGLVYSR